MLKKIVRTAKARLAYERESYDLGKTHLAQVKKDSPELYVKGYWRK